MDSEPNKNDVLIPIIFIAIVVLVVMATFLKDCIKYSRIGEIAASFTTGDIASHPDEPTPHDTTEATTEAALPAADNDAQNEPDEVFLPGYDIPIKLGMTEIDFLQAFNCSESSGYESYCYYCLTDMPDLWVFFKDKAVFYILFKNPTILYFLKNVIGCTRDAALSIIGQPNNYNTGTAISYVYDSSGIICDMANNDSKVEICLFYYDEYITHITISPVNNEASYDVFIPDFTIPEVWNTIKTD